MLEQALAIRIRALVDEEDEGIGRSSSKKVIADQAGEDLYFETRTYAGRGQEHYRYHLDVITKELNRLHNLIDHPATGDEQLVKSLLIWRYGAV